MAGQERFTFRDKLPKQPIRTGEEPVYGRIETPETKQKKKKPPEVPSEPEQVNLGLVGNLLVDKILAKWPEFPNLQERDVLDRTVESYEKQGLDLPQNLKKYEEYRTANGIPRI